jgi:hypothetical protein
MKIETLNTQELFGYEQKTTFFTDFSIAENFGKNAIKDTYKRAFESWKTNHIYLTELVMVLNWKMWIWDERDNKELAMLYNELWEQCDTYAVEHLKGKELEYFFRTTD